MITYQVEDGFQVKHEMAPIWETHWHELAVHKDRMPLDPDIAQYDALARAGIMHIVVGRKAGEMVAYHVSFVKPHLHYRHCLTAFEDLYFFHPAHRKGLLSVVNLFRHVERTLRARGVQRMLCAFKQHKPLMRVFLRLGFIACDVTVSKWIGD